MGLFNLSQIDKVNEVAARSKEVLEPPKLVRSKSINDDLNAISKDVVEYFKDSQAICITDKEQLHEYVTDCINAGYVGVDTETTGLDRVKDYIVGASLYTPGNVECYIPMKHKVPIFDTLYKNQLTYDAVAEEFKRMEHKRVRQIYANADFDLSMIYKDLGVDFIESCHYDVILAWRCLKENEKDNALKVLYNKYVMKGVGDPKKFSDFFSPQLFPYCKPEVAALYAANDAKITYELYQWQLPYVTKDNPKCKKAKLEHISDLIWNVEFPLIAVCQNMHRTGIYVDKDTASILKTRYADKQQAEAAKLVELVDEAIAKFPGTGARPFASGKDFNPKSPVHVKYLVYNILQVPKGDKGESTDKNVLADLNLPVTDQILRVRSLGVLINTFVDKMPKATTADSRIHAQFKSVGADTGRLSCAEPNLMNLPSHVDDIRHMFRATPGYVMLSSDYSRQEPAITAYVSGDKNMLDSFMNNRDIYASIASLAFNKPYEECLEFHPVTHEYQPDGKARRGEAKTILLGITYGRAIPSIADQLYGKREDMDDSEKVAAAQKVYDSVLRAFPGLNTLMHSAQSFARTHGYVETILGRRRHIPEMQLPEFEFSAMKGYVNPDIDPLDPTTLQNKSDIPERIKSQLLKEFKSYKYFGQIARRTKELYEQGIRVVNNRPKINDGSRQTVNSIIQGSAAEMTKLAMLKIENSKEWKEIGGRILVCVHDELICEVPIENWKRGGEILSSKMIEAAEFLPFNMTCDVTTTLRWYGESYPCEYEKPSSSNLDDWNESQIKWVQYHLREMEYLLPVYKNEDGSKPIGDAAHGINGVMSQELQAHIHDYISKRHLDLDRFIDYIEQETLYTRSNIKSL